MEKPISQMFINSVSEGEEGMEGYYTRIKKPMTLEQIHAKLLGNEYSSINEIKQSFQLIQSNAERFFGKGSYYSLVARELRNQFLKELAKMDENNPKVWAKRVSDADQKLEALFNQAPEKLKSRYMKKFTLEPLPKMKTRTMKMLIEATSELNNKKDALSFMNIILRFHPDMNVYSKDVEVDMDILSNETLWAIYAFTKKRFEEEKKDFPQMI